MSIFNVVTFLCASLKIYLKIAIMLSKFRVCMSVCMSRNDATK